MNPRGVASTHRLVCARVDLLPKNPVRGNNQGNQHVRRLTQKAHLHGITIGTTKNLLFPTTGLPSDPG